MPDLRPRPLRRLGRALSAAVLAVAVVVAAATNRGAVAAADPPAVPAFSHVVEVMLENESAAATFENPADTALQNLRHQGLYIPNFYGVGHASLDNYEAAFSAEEPTTQGKADCLGQPYGSCIFPASVPTFGTLLDDRSNRTWKVYSEGMAGAAGGGNCLHAPSQSAPDPYQGPGTNGYATRHNPAPWFNSVLTRGTNESYCKAHSVDLTQLTTDLKSSAALPSWSFVEPDTCHDGHDTSSSGGCALDPEGPMAPTGVGAIDAWLPGFVKQVTSAPAWDANSLLVITFDEGAATDTTGCAGCGDGSAGGRIGALLIGGQIAQPGGTTSWSGDHYSLLRTWETGWGLPSLKSLAADAAASKTVHDGDPGVLPLTGVWGPPATTPPATTPPATTGPSSITAPYAPPPGTGGGPGTHRGGRPHGRPRAPLCRIARIRVTLPHGPFTAAAAYLGGHRVGYTRGRRVRSFTVARPPSGAFTLRVVLRLANGRRTAIHVRVAGRGRLPHCGRPQRRTNR